MTKEEVIEIVRNTIRENNEAINEKNYFGLEKELLEKSIRNEENIKFLIQEIKDQREDMNKKSSSMQWIISLGFVILGTLVTVFKFLN